MNSSFDSISRLKTPHGKQRAPITYKRALEHALAPKLLHPRGIESRENYN